jgi:hypothetical protein
VQGPGGAYCAYFGAFHEFLSICHSLLNLMSMHEAAGAAGVRPPSRPSAAAFHPADILDK